MRGLLLIISFALFAYSCTKATNQIPQAHLTCLHIIDQNGFTETIASKDRLENYKNIDFLSPQPYQKVMQVFSKDESGSQKSFITSYYPNGFLRQYLECVNNRAYGKYEEWDSNGNLRVESKIVGGIADLSQEAEKSFIFDGYCKAYDREGRISAIISYKNGDLEGDSITYYPSGKIEKITSYKNNHKDGLCATYHENGNLRYITTYKNGVMHGKYEKYFPTGKIGIKGEHLNGYESGLWIDWHDKGFSKRQEGSYKVISLKEAKKLQLTEANPVQSDSLSVKHGTWITYFDGLGDKIYMQTDYKFGKIDGKQSTFYSNGNKQMVAQYKNALKNGKTFIYDKEGKVVEKLKFKHNKQIKK